jgi:hypothetical protein
MEGEAKLDPKLAARIASASKPNLTIVKAVDSKFQSKFLYPPQVGAYITMPIFEIFKESKWCRIWPDASGLMFAGSLLIPSSQLVHEASWILYQNPG